MDEIRIEPEIEPEIPEPYRLLKQSIMEAASGTGSVERLEHILRSHPSSEVCEVLQDARDDSDNKFNPLHLAVTGGHVQVVKAFLNFIAYHDRGADRSSTSASSSSFIAFDILHARDAKGHTAVHLAVVLGNETVLGILIRKYDKVHKRPKYEWDFADHIWMTPLHYAALGNSTAQMNQLLAWPEYDRHVNARDFFQRTPLHIASCHRPVRVEALLQHPAVDINAKDCFSLTPLHWAVYFGRTDVVRCFVELFPERGSAGKKALRAVGRDIEKRSVLEIAMEDSLLDLRPDVSNIFPRVPFQEDKFFLDGETASIHCDVSSEIEKLLLSCPDVSKEADSLEKNLGIYVSAVNAILLVAGLTLAASVRMGTEHLDGSRYEFVFFYMSFTCKLLSLYMSVVTILAGATILRQLGKSLQVARRVKYARNALYRISWLLGLSVFFFIVAFYAETAIQVRNDEPSRGTTFPYHIVSGLGGLLCIGVMWWFLRLHRFKMTLRYEMFALKSILPKNFLGVIPSMAWRCFFIALTILVGAVEPGFERLVARSFKLLLTGLPETGQVSFLAAVLENNKRTLTASTMETLAISIQGLASVGRRDLLARAKFSYDGYLVCKCVATEIRDTERITEEEIEEIRNRESTKTIKLGKLHIFEKTMKGYLAHWTVTEETEGTESPIESQSNPRYSHFGYIFLQTVRRLGTVLELRSVQDRVQRQQLMQIMKRGLRFRDRYWQRHRGAFEHKATLFLPIIENDIVKLEKVYVNLSLSQEEEDRRSGRYLFVMDRHYMGFLDRLPCGLFFWLQYYWEEGWTEAIAVFGRSYIVERDIRIWSEFSHQIESTRRR